MMLREPPSIGSRQRSLARTGKGRIWHGAGWASLAKVNLPLDPRLEQRQQGRRAAEAELAGL
eukprot:6258360-Prymnesium_polylepis.1